MGVMKGGDLGGALPARTPPPCCTARRPPPGAPLPRPPLPGPKPKPGDGTPAPPLINIVHTEIFRFFNDEEQEDGNRLRGS